MKHTWTSHIKADNLKVICAVCGIDKEEWEEIGKPPCKEKLPTPRDPEYQYGYL